MRMQMMIVRTLTAAVLFLLLAQVNVWVDTQTHLVLAVGYRAFLIGAPVFLFLGTSGGVRAAIALSLVGTLAGLFSLNSLTVAGIALGMAVSGYLAKSVMAHTTQGAADNKVSLNLGSLLSGLMVMGMANKTWMIVSAAALLVGALCLSLRIDWDAAAEPEETRRSVSMADTRRYSLFPFLGWSLIGVATGVKLTGIFTVLPQYLISATGALPRWFGMLVVLNSAVVILAQHRVLRLLDGKGTRAILVVSLSAMLLLSLPAVLRVEAPPMAVIWILLLTLGECALSLYDRLAKAEGYLFSKELMVGVGSFITVALSRSFPQQIYWSGVIGAGCLLIGSAALVCQRGEARVLSTEPLQGHRGRYLSGF